LRTEQTTVLDALRRLGGRAGVEAVAGRVGVSTSTVRRRLRELKTEQLVVKVGRQWQLKGSEFPSKASDLAQPLSSYNPEGSCAGVECFSIEHAQSRQEIHALEILAARRADILSAEARNDGFEKRRRSTCREAVAAMREFAAVLNAGRHDQGFVSVWPTAREAYKVHLAKLIPDYLDYLRWALRQVSTGRFGRKAKPSSNYHVEITGLADDGTDVTVGQE
jgi:DNA-binding Lrp family transcriptional regulator